jgi:hypothetical protein
MSYIINLNDSFYHGSPNKLLVLRNDFLWCALDYDIAVKYAGDGVIVYTVKTKRSLKLIDITNENFHKDFMNRVNNHFAFNKIKQIDKWKSLAPLGLPSLKIQLQHLPRTSSGVYPPSKNQKMIDTIEYFTEFIGNKHRYSAVTKEFGNLDTEMVKMIKQLYGNTVDGIISPSLWPSYHQGGFQHPEICIFEPVGKVSVSVSNVKRGGGKKQESNYTTFAEELREMGLDPDKMFTLNPLIFEKAYKE